MTLLIASAALLIQSSIQLDTSERSTYLANAAQIVSWMFLLTSIGLLISIIILYCSVKRRNNLKISDPGEFYVEMKQLLQIQVIFFLTYFLRFFSDYFAVPNIIDEQGLEACYVNPRYTYCASFRLMVYYIWTSFLWDFLPLALLFWSHYKNFSKKRNG